MKSRFLLALFFGVALKLAAQDVTVTCLSWVDPHDATDTLPQASIPAPDYPERLRGLTEIGYFVVEMTVTADNQFHWTPSLWVGTDPYFEEAVKNGMRDWKFTSAQRGGEPLVDAVRFAVIFNPRSAAKKTAQATPRLLDVTLPELSKAQAKKYGRQAKLYVTASVDADGRVTKAAVDAGSPDDLGQLAEDAVLKWTFAPAKEKGLPVARDVHVPVVFRPPVATKRNVTPVAEEVVPPRPIMEAQPVYPEALRRMGWKGEVKLQFDITTEGQVRNPVVISSTNPELNQSALDAILQWRFEPAKRNGVPVNVHLTMPIVFNLYDNGSEVGREPYRVEDDTDQNKLPTDFRYDLPPKPASTAFAIYPFEPLRDGVEGSAEVKFLVGPDGSVVHAEVTQATRPEFGLALLAMLDEWKFLPAMKAGKPTWAVMTTKRSFWRRNFWHDELTDVPVSEPAAGLLRELKKENPDLCPIKELDAKPQVLSRHPPVFPSALVGKVDKGEAVVEFLVDHDGNVQLPRIVSATDPAFGYAAVQGVAAWKFSPPTSHGKPVVIRVQIPVKFSAPAPKPPAPVPPAQN